MNEEYDARISGHDEDCSYWVDDDNCFCHLFERDLAYTNGFRAAVSKMAEQGDLFDSEPTSSDALRAEAEHYNMGYATGLEVGKRSYASPPNTSLHDSENGLGTYSGAYNAGSKWMRDKIATLINLELEDRGCADREKHVMIRGNDDCNLCWLSRGYENSYDIAKGVL